VPCLHRFGASMPTAGRRGSQENREFTGIQFGSESSVARMLAPQSRCKHGTPDRPPRIEILAQRVNKANALTENPLIFRHTLNRLIE
jgi:hypothetical protein